MRATHCRNKSKSLSFNIRFCRIVTTAWTDKIKCGVCDVESRAIFCSRTSSNCRNKEKGVVKNSEIMNDKLFTKLRSRGARVLPDVLNCYDMDELKIKCFISEN